MKISELAKESNLSIDTIRYYQKVGLIKPKKEGFFRVYGEEDLEIISAIKVLKSTGMPLKNIKLIVEMETQEVDFKLLKEILDEHLEWIKKQEIDIKTSKKIIAKALEKVNGKLI